MSRPSFDMRFLQFLLIAAAGCATTSSGKGESPRGAAEMEAAAARTSEAVGLAAPAFAVPNQDDETVRLEQFRGKWGVLYFYPKDDTPGCVCEATEFTDLLWKFHAVQAEVVGVSPDPPETHRKFQKKYGLQIQLLSDTRMQVIRQYGAWVEAGVGNTRSGRVVRSTFIIDPNGKIAYHWPEVIPQGHANRVKAKLDELRAAVAKANVSN